MMAALSETWSGPPITTARMIALYGSTLPLLVALRDVARSQALRRGHRPVPQLVCTQARTLLAAARRVVSRDPGAGLLDELREVPDWAGLHSKLELALAAFATFRATYSYHDRELGMVTWRDEDWVSFQAMKSESARQASPLQKSAENLST
jgi:hypothetical protein